MSLSLGGELSKKLSFGGDSRASKGFENRVGVVENWNLELGSLTGGSLGACVNEEEDQSQELSNDGSEDEGQIGVQDEAFKRLSELLASLQAQAEAAVSNHPMVSNGGEETLTDGTDDVEDYHRNATSKSRKRSSLRESDFPSFSSRERPDRLLRASFRRTNSLPFGTHTFSFSPPLPNPEENPTIITTDSDNAGTGELTPLSPVRSTTDPVNPANMDHRSTTHRRVNSASHLSLPLRRRSLVSSPPASGLSTAIHSGCSSPRSMSLSRRGSYLIKDMGLEGLLGDLIEMGNMANQTVLEHQGFMAWVWALLAGGGVLWLAVGWALKWNCHCQCPLACTL